MVKTKGYRNESEALRKVIEEHFEEHPELFAGDELQEALKQANEMSEAEFERVASQIFRGHEKKAAQLVAEGRDR